jgi:hypothetical protein
VLARARSLYRRRRELKWMLLEERRSPYPIPAPERLKSWRHGFITEHWLLYGLDRPGRDRSLYVTDRARYLRLSQLNRPYAQILHDKLLFTETFRRHGDVLPEAFAFVRRGRVWPLSRDEPIDSIDALFGLLARRGRLVLKGVQGQEGSDTTVLEDRGGELLVAGAPMAPDAARRHVASRRPQILTEYVEQAAYSREIFPGSANSVRMLTMVDRDTQEPFLARALHRFGTSSSRGIDSVARGGIRATVDAETGRIGQGFRVTAAGRPETLDAHPETGSRITGVEIPGWEAAVSRVLSIAREHPYLPYVGWDVVFTDGGIRILEGNSNSGLDGLQHYEPLLADPRVRRFFQSRGVL